MTLSELAGRLEAVDGTWTLSKAKGVWTAAIVVRGGDKLIPFRGAGGLGRWPRVEATGRDAGTCMVRALLAAEAIPEAEDLIRNSEATTTLKRRQWSDELDLALMAFADYVDQTGSSVDYHGPGWRVELDQH